MSSAKKIQNYSMPTLTKDLPGFRYNNIFYLPCCFDLWKRKPIQWLLKKILDFILALIALIFFMPVLIITAIAIKMDSQGSIIFKQKRIGFLGKEFDIYKFRSMTHDAEEKLSTLISQNESNSKMFKMFNDPRITRIGKIIRKYSIDELPQLINVLKGEMSLVGFRPPLPQEVANYNKSHMIRFSTMPGITGIWQVSGRSNIIDFDKIIDLERKYLTNWSLLSDIIIIFKTIPVVLSAEGAA